MQQQSEKQKKVLELADMDSFVIGGKTFLYRKITGREFNQLERMKLSLRKEQDAEKASETIDKIYRLSAKYYLEMSDEDFDNSPLEDVLLVIEGCNHRSMFGKPFLLANSLTSSDSAAKSTA